VTGLIQSVRSVALALLLVLPSAALAARPGQASAANVVPAQFTAKLYTEGLGRAPSPAEWVSWTRYFEREGCDARSVRRAAHEVLGGRAFLARSYGPQDRLAAAYRAVLNRDLDVRAAAAARERDRTWPRTLAAVLGRVRARSVCDPRRAAQGFDDRRALWSPRSAERGFRGSEEALQRALDRAARRGGGTVWLAQRAVVRVGAGKRREQLRVPPGVTLATVGSPGPHEYLRMARLARVGDSCLGGRSCGQPVIVVDGATRADRAGGVLHNVWIDGRGGDRRLRGSAVQMESGANAAVRDSRLTGSARRGGNVLGLHGSSNFGGRLCRGARAAGNLITGYTTVHRFGRVADGITVACEQARVENNAIVDASDVGIALFGNAGTAQRSSVHRNTILSAGNSAYAGIAVDPHGVCADACADVRPRNFTGASVTGNRLFTGPRTAFGFGVTLGIRALYDAPPDGFGVAATDNGTGAASARVTVGVAVSGMHDVRLASGPSRWVLTEANTCPSAVTVASLSAGLASFASPPPPLRDAPIVRCWQDAT